MDIMIVIVGVVLLFVLMAIVSPAFVGKEQ